MATPSNQERKITSRPKISQVLGILQNEFLNHLEEMKPDQILEQSRQILDLGTSTKESLLQARSMTSLIKRGLFKSQKLEMEQLWQQVMLDQKLRVLYQLIWMSGMVVLQHPTYPSLRLRTDTNHVAAWLWVEREGHPEKIYKFPKKTTSFPATTDCCVDPHKSGICHIQELFTALREEIISQGFEPTDISHLGPADTGGWVPPEPEQDFDHIQTDWDHELFPLICRPSEYEGYRPWRRLVLCSGPRY